MITDDGLSQCVDYPVYSGGIDSKEGRGVVPASRKCPDELRRRAIRLVFGAPWRTRSGLGVFQTRRRKELGINPETLRGRGPVWPGATPEVPGTTTGDAQRLSGAGVGGPRVEAGGATRWGASAFLPWRSVSAHRVDLRLNRGRERESSGACAGSAIHADAVGVQDRPRPRDSRRPQHATIGPLDLGRGHGREDPRPEGRAAPTPPWSRAKPGASGAPGRRAPGGPAPRVRRMRAPGLSGAGRPAAPQPRRPPSEPAVGGRRPPACRPGRGPTAPRSSPGPLRPPRRRLGHESAHGAPTTRSAPSNKRSGRARTAAATWQDSRTTATTDPSHPPRRPQPNGLAEDGTQGIHRSRGIPLRGRRRRSPHQAPANAGPVLAPRPLEGMRRPRKPRPPPGSTGTNRTRPHPTNDDDLPPTAAEHRYNHNHTTTV